MTPKRFIGLDLTGAKNSKTTIAVLEFFPREKKLFVLDVQGGIGPEPEHSGDAVLTETLIEHAENHENPILSVNSALTLPPCIQCTRKVCNKECASPEVKWMRTFAKNNGMSQTFTPYTQRPVELFLKHWITNHLPERLCFEIDETLGGNRAPLSARMNFLKRSLEDRFELQECHSKLSAVLLGLEFKIPHRVLERYRSLEEGVSAREDLLHQLMDRLNLFIYERDRKKLAEHLNSFDAFICATSAWIASERGQIKAPKGFLLSSGWITIPQLGAAGQP
jgi:hypothetical protein